jgi:hypothetical protein
VSGQVFEEDKEMDKDTLAAKIEEAQLDKAVADAKA